MKATNESKARKERREAIINAAYDLDPSLVLIRPCEAADILSVSPSLLANARSSGRMLGRPAPKHVQLDTTVRYRLSDLTAWLESALEDTSSAPGAKPVAQGASTHA